MLRGATIDARVYGEVDSMDLARGGGLLVLLPIIFFMLAGLLGPDSQARPARSPVNSQTDLEEVAHRWRVVEARYLKDATRLLAHTRKVKDRTLREHCRRWTHTSLSSVESELQSFVSFLGRSSESQPELRGQLASYLQRCEKLRKKLEPDLNWIRKQDTLGLDRR